MGQHSKAAVNLLMLRILASQECSMMGLNSSQAARYTACRVTAHFVYAGFKIANNPAPQIIRLHCSNVKMEA